MAITEKHFTAGLNGRFSFAENLKMLENHSETSKTSSEKIKIT